MGACGNTGEEPSPSNGNTDASLDGGPEVVGGSADASGNTTSDSRSNADVASGPTCGTTAPWGGLLEADMNGVKRSGTPGALEACTGADPNGYLARYECRKDNPNCNVDVAALGQRACDQTISTSTTPADNWSAIDWSHDTICIQNGDHTGRGILAIPSNASGTASNYKVLRYARASTDNDDEPWNQAEGDKAKVRGLQVSGSYWLIHRLTFPGLDGSSPSPRVESRNGASHHIFNRILVEGLRSSSNYYGYSEDCNTSGYSDINVQNSVFRNVGPYGQGVEAIAVDLQCGNNLRSVNNEIFDWVSHPIQLGQNGMPTLRGIVVENNDLYVTPALYTDCNGNYTTSGACAATETPLSVKIDGLAQDPVRLLHNRIWGNRMWDGNLCCNGTVGDLTFMSNGVGTHDQYVVTQSNVFMDAMNGILFTVTGTSKYHSIVGNLFYKFKKIDDGVYGSIAVDLSHAQDTEFYLNTVIDTQQYMFGVTGEAPNADVRCNAFLNGVTSSAGSPAGSAQAAFNVFYDAPSFAFNAPGTNTEKAISTRADSAPYALGAVMRTSSIDGCVTMSDAACFLYRATVAGASAGSAPTPCTTLGCTYSDGSVTWQAFRGPASFKRKLRTVAGGETMVVPYAKPHVSAFEYGTCPGTARPERLGGRAGIGVSDEAATWQ